MVVVNPCCWLSNIKYSPLQHDPCLKGSNNGYFCWKSIRLSQVESSGKDPFHQHLCSCLVSLLHHSPFKYQNWCLNKGAIRICRRQCRGARCCANVFLELRHMEGRMNASVCRQSQLGSHLPDPGFHWIGTKTPW